MSSCLFTSKSNWNNHICLVMNKLSHLCSEFRASSCNRIKKEFSCESLFLKISTLQNSEQLPLCFVYFSAICLKKFSEWFSSISEAVAANLVSKSFGCRNAISILLSENAKSSSMLSPAWSSLNTFWNLSPHYTTTPSLLTYFENSFKTTRVSRLFLFVWLWLNEISTRFENIKKGKM